MARTRNRIEHDPSQRIYVPAALFDGIDRRAIRAFCRIPAESLAARVCRDLDLDEMPWRSLSDSLEAAMVAGPMPPILMGILNYVVDAVQPAMDRIPRKQSCSRKNCHPWFDDLRSKLENAICAGSPPDSPIFTQTDRSDGGDDDELLRRIANFYANDFIRDPARYRREFAEAMGTATRPGKINRSLSTDCKILQLLPTALTLVRDGLVEGRMNSALRQTAQVVWSSRTVPIHGHFEAAYRTPIKRSPRRVPLYPPSEIRAMYAIADPPASYAELIRWPSLVEEAAFRALRSILVHGWQRHCSLVHLELGDMLLAGDHPEIVIRWSKSGWTNQRVPIWAVMPDEEISGLRSLLRYAVKDLGCSWDVRLTELAGLGRFEAPASAIAQRKFCEAMARRVSEFQHSTHLPRASGLSWAPVRALVAHHPELVNHPILAPLRGDPWFRPGDLAKFRGIIPSTLTDSAEIFRRIACWATTEQFISSYCRSWHVLLALRLELAALH